MCYNKTAGEKPYIFSRKYYIMYYCLSFFDSFIYACTLCDGIRRIFLE